MLLILSRTCSARPDLSGLLLAGFVQPARICSGIALLLLVGAAKGAKTCFGAFWAEWVILNVLYFQRYNRQV